MKRPFGKPATTHAQQVIQLQRRGMIIDDPTAAAFSLQHLNYYRLSAYWLPFEADHATHTFRPNTHFSQVLNLYVFDRELRLLVPDAIERVEVSMRSQWAYQLAHHHGPYAHLDAALAFKSHLWRTNLEKLSTEVSRSDEPFIKHIRDTYTEALPPVWAACEVMSLGLLSRWYNNLRPMATRRAIAAVYGVDEKVLESWLRHLSLVRNICAHHGRLWNREFTIITSHDVSMSSMGFPANWHTLPIWQDRGDFAAASLSSKGLIDHSGGLLMQGPAAKPSGSPKSAISDQCVGPAI